MKYDIKLKMKLAPHQLKAFKKFLSKGPYAQVNKMLASINAQVAAQDLNAASGTLVPDATTPTTP
jgi:hypothetical protein